MITEINTKENEFLIEFKKFNGTGWANKIEKIIKEKIKPDKFSVNEIEVNWYYSEIEFTIEKDDITFITHLDDEGSRYLLLKSKITEENKGKLREWAIIIATDIEKLKK